MIGLHVEEFAANPGVLVLLELEDMVYCHMLCFWVHLGGARAAW